MAYHGTITDKNGRLSKLFHLNGLGDKGHYRIKGG